MRVMVRLDGNGQIISCPSMVRDNIESLVRHNSLELRMEYIANAMYWSGIIPMGKVVHETMKDVFRECYKNDVSLTSGPYPNDCGDNLPGFGKRLKEHGVRWTTRNGYTWRDCCDIMMSAYHMSKREEDYGYGTEKSSQ